MVSRSRKRLSISRTDSLDRRNFLKLGISTAATSLAPSLPVKGVAAENKARDRLSKVSPIISPKATELPLIPTLEDLASDRLVHRLTDYFNPPVAQNEWGCVQLSKSVSAIQSISFPPFTCCGAPSPGVNFTLTCDLFLNGRVLVSYPRPAGEVAYTWYPHRVLRESEVEGIEFRTETFAASRKRAVLESIRVRNTGGESRRISVGFDLRAGVTSLPGKPWMRNPDPEDDNQVTVDESRGCLVFESRHHPAVSVQGISPPPDRIEQRERVVYKFSLGPGESRTFHYVNVIAEDPPAARAAYEESQANFDRLAAENEAVFTQLVKSAFTPGNGEFSGHLPQLVTRSRELWKLYYRGFTNLLFCRRVSPDSVYGPTYLTVLPYVGPTRTFLWDTALTALSLALLDPQVLRVLLEVWLASGMHDHNSTDYLTGKGLGAWYAANDFAILRCADYYLRVTGDFTWLDKRIESRSVVDHLTDHALYWKTLDTSGHGLADYGESQNLMEVVSTWSHEVPALNAGNVYGMRFVASLLERRGQAARAAHLRFEAKALAENINRRLYVNGKGWWRCGQPDGSFNEVRTAYDMLSILDCMYNDLAKKQKKEMSYFFWSELATPLWMHALSPYDVDADWRLRADGTWTGASSPEPPLSAKALYKIDSSKKVAAWLKRVSGAANQGPFGQAHTVESVFPPEHNGAYKCPPDFPYGNDWCEIDGGTFTDLVIDTIVGANPTLFDGIQLKSHVDDFDPETKFLNLHYQGKNYAVRQGRIEPMA